MDVFVFDRQAKTFQRISVTTDAEESAGPSVAPALSADGRFVTFVSFVVR